MSKKDELELNVNKNEVELSISGIKCDACDYFDPDVKVEDYKDWVNKPCPKCNANLLTESDFNNVQILLQTTKILNNLSPQQLETLSGNVDNLDNDVVKMIVEMNGTGNMDFKIKK